MIFLLETAQRVSRSSLARMIRSPIRSAYDLCFILFRSGFGRRLSGFRNTLTFLTYRQAYNRIEQLDLLSRGASSTYWIFHAAVTSLLSAAVVVAALATLPALYSEYLTPHGWPSIALPSVGHDDYAAILGIVAQTAAAMLALFFTSITVVASTSYAKVSTEIRMLVGRDPLNRRYLGLLAHTATVSTAGIAILVFGIEPSFMIAGYVTLLAVISLLAFLPLGMRTFTLFDPSILATIPVGLFSRSLKNALRPLYRTQPSFQRHAGSQAQKAIELLSDLVGDVSFESETHPGVVRSLATKLIYIGGMYSNQKHGIPCDSLWFPKRAEFKKWHLADSTMTSIALETGVQAPPKQVPDEDFIDRVLLDAVSECLASLLSAGETREAFRLLIDINDLATSQACAMDQQQSRRTVAKTRSMVIDYILTENPVPSLPDQLQLMDILGTIALAPVLTSALVVLSKTDSDLSELCTRLLQLDDRSFHSRPWPRQFQNRMNDVFMRLQFERDAEGTIRSKPWYTNQMIAEAYSVVLVDTIDGIAECVETEFVEVATSLVASGRIAAAAAWLQRCIEACRKAEAQIDSISLRFEELRRFSISELPWPESTAPAALTKVRSLQRKVSLLLAELVPKLEELPTDGACPDFIGQTRAWLGDELVQLMEARDPEGFANLFGAYFSATISIHQRIVRHGPTVPSRSNVRSAADVLADLLSLSGTALIFSELDGTDFGELVKARWDRFFAEVKDGRHLLGILWATLNAKLILPVFSAGAIQRQEWNQRLVGAMRDRGVAVDREFDYGIRRMQDQHGSDVINSMTGSFGMLLHETADYFWRTLPGSSPRSDCCKYSTERDELHRIDIPVC